MNSFRKNKLNKNDINIIRTPISDAKLDKFTHNGSYTYHKCTIIINIKQISRIIYFSGKKFEI